MSCLVTFMYCQKSAGMFLRSCTCHIQFAFVFGPTLTQAKLFRSEVIEAVNCEFCAKPTTATRQDVVRQFPHLLCLCLKRFGFEVGMNMAVFNK